MKSIPALAAALFLTVFLVGCGSDVASAPAMSSAAAGSSSRLTASPPASTGFGASTATVVQTAVEKGSYACIDRGSFGAFRHVECPKTGVADIDLYVRADGTLAGIDAYAGGTPMTAAAMLAVLGPAFDAAIGSGGWDDIAAAVRAAGAPASGTTTILPNSGLSVMVQGYAASQGLVSLAVLAPDLAASWGNPPVPSPS